MTDYESLRELKPKEPNALVKQTTAQWSDGIGESYYWQEVRPGMRFSPLLKAAEAGQ